MSAKSFIFFGASGAGKGTQAKLLLEHLKQADQERGVVYVETGAEFRQFMENDNFTSGCVKKVLAEGGLLPEFLPIWIWTSALIRGFTGNENIVFDGICRRIPEAPVVDGALDFYNFKDRYVVYIKVSKEWALKRLLERGRYDDNEEDIRARLDWYEQNVVPVVDIFRKNDKYKFIQVNGEQSIEDVQKEILKEIV